MVLLRKLLFPFAILYGLVTGIRNFLYDRGIFRVYVFDVPVIAVGNLSMGGTGKTPQIEYLVRLLSDKYKIATLSRGYKRKSKGFILADRAATAEILGDEPFQFYNKFPNITVAVDADRKNGIEQLLAQPTKPEVILLDDAFQHRKVKAGFYVLLTAYGDLFEDDFLLPTGNLRESRNGAKRAHAIIVTKCPKSILETEQNEIREKLQLSQHQRLYFTCIDYDSNIYSQSDAIDVNAIRNNDKILLAGIANPKPFFDYLRGENDMAMAFPDHHDFTDSEITRIGIQAKTKIIIATEKDYVRLKDSALKSNLYYLPIRTRFISGSKNFDKTILDYVTENQGIVK